MKGHENKKNTPITDHGGKNGERKKNACVAVKRGVRVRRNCNMSGNLYHLHDLATQAVSFKKYMHPPLPLPEEEGHIFFE
jgi:hypothetical protein